MASSGAGPPRRRSWAAPDGIIHRCSICIVHRQRPHRTNRLLLLLLRPSATLRSCTARRSSVEEARRGGALGPRRCAGAAEAPGRPTGCRPRLDTEAAGAARLVGRVDEGGRRRSLPSQRAYLQGEGRLAAAAGGDRGGRARRGPPSARVTGRRPVAHPAV
jgi:hypothetical protein